MTETLSFPSLATEEQELPEFIQKELAGNWLKSFEADRQQHRLVCVLFNLRELRFNFAVEPTQIQLFHGSKVILDAISPIYMNAIFTFLFKQTFDKFKDSQMSEKLGASLVEALTEFIGS